METETITLQFPTRTGYTFEGWYAEADFTTKVTEIAKGSTGDKTFYAKWSIVKYTVTYKLNGGKNNANNPTTYDVTSDEIALKNATRTGYTFSGWYTEDGAKGKVSRINRGSTGHIVLYAHWTANKYTIVLNGNGATSGTMAKRTATYDKALKLSSNTYKRTGYTFDGWNTRKDGKGKAYKNKASVKNLSAKAGAKVTLYAQWKPVKYKITYKLNGGKNNSGNPKTYDVTTATIKLKTPTKKGYTFAGWFSDSKFKKKVTQIAKGSTGNRTLYAKWVKK